jgi:hypothetical protein
VNEESACLVSISCKTRGWRAVVEGKTSGKMLIDNAKLRYEFYPKKDLFRKIIN